MVVASSNSDITRKAVCAPAVLSVEKLSSLVARKRFLPTEYSALSLIGNSKKRWMVFKGFLSLFSYSLYNNIQCIKRNNGNIPVRKEKPHRQPNGMCVNRESLGNVRIFSLFSSFLEYLSYHTKISERNYGII